MATHPHHIFTPSPWRRNFCSLSLVAAAVAAAGAVASSLVAKQQGAAVSKSAVCYAKDRAVGDGTHCQRTAGRIFRCAR